jgi:hypothetical protein
MVTNNVASERSGITNHVISRRIGMVITMWSLKGVVLTKHVVSERSGVVTNHVASKRSGSN